MDKNESPQAQITVATSTLDRIRLLALAWQVDEGEAVARLLQHFEKTAGRSGAPASAPAGHLPVHAVYGGRRFDGVFDTASKGLSIPAGPAAGDYRTPSGAAAAVVQAVKPGVASARNGWSFWIISDTGEALQTQR
ncbi:hypothetical protein [Streptomyces sp. NPDC060184]|uniref:hypothetical protein n=1 Tax=Streptomyces sp. NPDC060184 TaxID=3347064 RepID=UPI0036649D28